MFYGEPQARVRELKAFKEWETISIDQQNAFNELMSNGDNGPDKREEYFDITERDRKARESLKLGIVDMDERYLSLAYKLGTIAALDVTRDRLDVVSRDENGYKLTIKPDFSQFDINDHGIRPSSDPMTLAMQIGEELERLSLLLSTSISVPVLMVWNYEDIYPKNREDPHKYIEGIIPNPRNAFKLRPPKVIKDKEGERVEYEIPSRLQGVRIVARGNKRAFNRSEAVYSNPLITSLSIFGVINSAISSGSNPDALYVGALDVKQRISRAKKDKSRVPKVPRINLATARIVSETRRITGLMRV